MPDQVSGLKPASYNPRSISKAQLQALKKAMAEFGDLGGIVVNKRTGNLVGGHQRVKHLKPEWFIFKEPYEDKTGTVALGHIETPWGRWAYREVDWSPEKEMAANVAANRHGGEFEDEGLKKLLAEVGGLNFDLALTGFDLEEINELLGTAPEPAAPAAKPKQAQGVQDQDDDSPPEAPQHQFLVQAILTADEHRRWSQLKGGRADKAFIVELIADVA
ncbi:MAG: hypothetical protein V1806_04890 [Pseudomonadota bacterium]